MCGYISIKNNIFILTVLSLLLPDCSSQICTKIVDYTETVQKVHIVKVPVTKYRSRFWGTIKTEWVDQERAYTQLEYRTKLKEVCCKGYVMKGRTCVPLCDEVCENGKCTAPNTCSCHDGYTKFNQFRCIPYCEHCEHGYCSSPGVCNCYSNYERGPGGRCLPICTHKCENGFCAAPNVCNCNENYEKWNDSSCVPICKQKCENGKCIEPNNCQCLEGYEMDKNGTCAPKCSELCTHHGTCVAPNTCECFLGYQLSKDNTCDPFCSKNCLNGKCVGPEVCECDAGYTQSPNGECVPICSTKCPNGICKAPNTCECNVGYTLADDGACHPYCPEGCENGFCFSPNMCVCNPGYKKDDNDNCVPVCSLQCVNGYCSQPEICECLDGYEMPPNQVNQCLPICATNCTTSCEKPHTCDCPPGLVHDISNTCVLDCANCLNGYCGPQNTCLCKHGFELVAENVCMPAVTHSPHNFKYNTEHEQSQIDLNDTASGTESLLENSNYDNTSEVAGCDEQHCKFGNCTNDQCLCNAGFNFNGTECVPYCSIECINGFCIDPDACSCHDGYILLNSSSCVPLCNGEEDGCIHGVCVAIDTCRCLKGFIKSPENQFECIESISLTNGEKRIMTNIIWPYVLFIVAVFSIIVTGFAYYRYSSCCKHSYRVDNQESQLCSRQL